MSQLPAMIFPSATTKVKTMRELTKSFKGGVAPYYQVDIPIPPWFGDMMVNVKKHAVLKDGFHAAWNFNMDSDIPSTVRLYTDPQNVTQTTIMFVDGPSSNDVIFKYL